MLRGLKPTILIALVLVSILLQSNPIEAKERGRRERDNQVERVQEKAIRRASEQAQANAERSAERLQNKYADKVISDIENERGHAAGLVYRIRASKHGSGERVKNLKLLRKKYNLALVMNKGKETLVRAREIIALNISTLGRATTKRLMLKNVRSYELNSIGLKIDVFRSDDNGDLTSLLTAIKQADPEGQYEFNMVYESTSVTSSSSQNITTTMSNNDNPFTIGLIDTGVNVEHKSLQHMTVIQENFGRGEKITPRNHGTAISSIIARYGNARVYVADVFSGPAGYSDSEAIINALDWLARLNIGVINMSLAGPDNVILRHTVSQLTNKGHIIVAAVGNEGASGPARFPAAYEKVVGVTAVDAEQNIYIKANQDNYVDIAAPGVDIIASATEGERKYSGTSFASAFVSASLAPEHIKADRINATEVIQLTISGLTDLGQVGYDPVFGFGLLNTKKYYPAGE